MKTSKLTATIEVIVVKATLDAVLVETGPEEDPVWIPRSQIEEADDELTVGFHGEITIPLWLAEREGLA